MQIPFIWYANIPRSFMFGLATNEVCVFVRRLRSAHFFLGATNFSERLMPKNSSLRKANRIKNDEFYTKLCDVQYELSHYSKRFFSKIVYCNCDDPFESNFFKYFALNFNALGLKKLVCTCYRSPVFKQLNLFSSGEQTDLIGELNLSDDFANYRRGGAAYKMVVNAAVSGLSEGLSCRAIIKKLLKNKQNSIELLKGNGDFRSGECLQLLKQADVVVTNPPFSLLREFVATLINAEKEFLIIGSQNAITYKEIFYLLKQNKIWLGYKSGSQEFFVPPEFEGANVKINAHGERTVKFGNICWFTNLDIPKRHSDLPFAALTVQPIAYDNYPAVNVDKISQIPSGYSGAMGVPITFLQKHNPAQFEIIDAINRYSLFDVFNTNEQVRKNRSHTCNVGGQAKYFRIIIKAK